MMYLYQAIAETIKYRILSGYYPPNSTIPPIRTLAITEDCNTATICKALKKLCNIGLVSSKRTSGYIVTSDYGLIDRLRYLELEEATAHLCDKLSSFGFSNEEIIELIKEVCNDC